MQSESYFTVRLDACTNCGLVAMLVGLLVAVGISALLGALSPTVYNTSGKSKTLRCDSYDCDPSFFGYLNRITKKNQLVFLELVMEKPMEHNVDAHIAFQHQVQWPLELIVSVDGEHDNDHAHRVPIIHQQKYTRKVTCPANSDTCDPVVLWGEPFLEYEGYHVQVTFVHPYQTHGIVNQKHKEVAASGGRASDITTESMHEKAMADQRFIPENVHGYFEMKYVNVSFTNFEYCVKYICTSFTCFVAIWYFCNLRKVDRKFRSYEQNWITVLLLALFFFNDPFFGIEIATAWSFWTGLYVGSEVTLTCMLLMFFLSVFDIVGSPSYQEGEGRVIPYTFYLPKLFLVGPIWVFQILIFMYVRLQDQSDPSYTEPMNMDHFKFAKRALDIWLILYVAYAFLLLCLILKTSCGASRAPKKYMYLFLITVLSFGFTIIGNIIGAFSPEIVEKEAFFFFLGTANSYIWILAFCYCPNNKSEAGSGAGKPKATRNKNPLAARYQGSKAEGASGNSSLRMENMPRFPPQALQAAKAKAAAEAEAVAGAEAEAVEGGTGAPAQC